MSHDRLERARRRLAMRTARRLLVESAALEARLLVENSRAVLNATRVPPTIAELFIPPDSAKRDPD
jgi:hypothetical protein